MFVEDRRMGLKRISKTWNISYEHIFHIICADLRPKLSVNAADNLEIIGPYNDRNLGGDKTNVKRVMETC